MILVNFLTADPIIYGKILNAMADSIFDQRAIDMNFGAESTKREAYQTDST